MNAKRENGKACAGILLTYNSKVHFFHQMASLHGLGPDEHDPCGRHLTVKGVPRLVETHRPTTKHLGEVIGCGRRHAKVHQLQGHLGRPAGNVGVHQSEAEATAGNYGTDPDFDLASLWEGVERKGD